jgi:integrase
LLLTPNGSRGWRFKYHLAGKEGQVSLGPYPDISIAAAREAARTARQHVREGRNPSAERRAARERVYVEQAQTFGVVGLAFLAWEKDTPQDDPTASSTRRQPRRKILSRRTVDKHAWLFEQLAPLHRHPIGSIDAPMVLKVVEGIAALGKADAARRAGQFVSRVFRYAINRKLGGVTVNPAANLRGELPAVESRSHPALVEPRWFGFLMRIVDSDEIGFATTRHGLQLIARTALRPGELRMGLWSEIDWDKAEWRVPAHRMKMKREHLVPLSKQAIEILRRQQEVTGHGLLIFPGVRSGRAMSDNTMNLALKGAFISGQDHTVHGFRSSFSTLLNEAGYDSALIELQLSHAKRDKIAGIYDRSERVQERRVMMQAWADKIDEFKKLPSP